MKLNPLNILSVDAHFHSEQDRIENANKNKLKGVGRLLYLGRKVKLSKIDSLLESGKGLANIKVIKTEQEKKGE
jgi:hypothetical protein